ncbi:UNVERIFIED_CONTAM: protein ENHANCED DISEASE RESISTANCE 2 [Sesamum calycinum]|uniref:Protein ENHANCED DISEASE RESISTANCE 2 n=1 Tax=Sesamum calycinum TaxID=2727403 RepID=A0AAW2SDQ4_9LAMI
MGVSQSDGGRMEGWLYLIRSNRIGLQYSRNATLFFKITYSRVSNLSHFPLTRMFWIPLYGLDGLEFNIVSPFALILIAKSFPLDPVRSAIIDSCIRVTDNGRESIHRKVIFIFTLYNTSNHNDQLKLGANSPEEAAKWIQSFQESALKPNQNQGDFEFATREPQSLRLNCSSKHSHSIDWTAYSSSVSDAMTSDVVAPSPWKIFGCRNGLRLFKEAKDKEHHGKWDDHPAIMAVGVVGTSEGYFQTLMSLGPSRSEWDFCFYKGSVIEHLDGHTDIVHKILYRHWLPWGMKRRDLLLRRYWRREDDGTYVILYHSVFHQKCPPKRVMYAPALKVMYAFTYESGGYVISPVNQGKRSVVKHMLAIDWKFWRSYLQTSSARSITISMLGRLAALRELFKAKVDCSSSDFSSGELMSNNSIQPSKKELKVEVQTRVENGQNWEDVEKLKTPSERSSLVGLHDASDEFFDVSEPLDYDQSENGWPSDFGSEVYSQDARQPKLSTAAVFVKRLHELAGIFTEILQKKGYVDLHEMAREDSLSCKWMHSSKGSNLPKRKDSFICFLFQIKAKGTLMEMKYAAKGGPEFFFIVNIQVPGSTTYNLALYYMMSTPLEDAPLLESFVKGDDAYRNSRFKLIPYISKGSWIVKQSVGKKACLVGQALEINYFHGKNYLELTCWASVNFYLDMESMIWNSLVIIYIIHSLGSILAHQLFARGVVSLVLGYLNNLVIEMAFLVQANTPEELPEYLIGTCRLNHLDVSKSVLVKP